MTLEEPTHPTPEEVVATLTAFFETIGNMSVKALYQGVAQYGTERLWRQLDLLEGSLRHAELQVIAERKPA